MNGGLAEAKKFVEEHGMVPFEPFAFYDKHLDCIRVRLADCSMIERRAGKIFTMVINSDSGDAVGFNIKGIRHLFERLGLPAEGVYELAEIIDEIVKEFPDRRVKQVKHEFGSIIAEKKIEVEIALAA